MPRLQLPDGKAHAALPPRGGGVEGEVQIVHLGLLLEGHRGAAEGEGSGGVEGGGAIRGPGYGQGCAAERAGELAGRKVGSGPGERNLPQFQTRRRGGRIPGGPALGLQITLDGLQQGRRREERPAGPVHPHRGLRHGEALPLVAAAQADLSFQGTRIKGEEGTQQRGHPRVQLRFEGGRRPRAQRAALRPKDPGHGVAARQGQPQFAQLGPDAVLSIVDFGPDGEREPFDERLAGGVADRHRLQLQGCGALQADAAAVGLAHRGKLQGKGTAADLERRQERLRPGEGNGVQRQPRRLGLRVGERELPVRQPVGGSLGQLEPREPPAAGLAHVDVKGLQLRGIVLEPEIKACRDLDGPDAGQRGRDLVEPGHRGLEAPGRRSGGAVRPDGERALAGGRDLGEAEAREQRRELFAAEGHLPGAGDGGLRGDEGGLGLEEGFRLGAPDQAEARGVALLAPVVARGFDTKGELIRREGGSECGEDGLDSGGPRHPVGADGQGGRPGRTQPAEGGVGRRIGVVGRPLQLPLSPGREVGGRHLEGRGLSGTEGRAAFQEESGEAQIKGQAGGRQQAAERFTVRGGRGRGRCRFGRVRLGAGSGRGGSACGFRGGGHLFHHHVQHLEFLHLEAPRAEPGPDGVEGSDRTDADPQAGLAERDALQAGPREPKGHPFHGDRRICQCLAGGPGLERGRQRHAHRGHGEEGSGTQQQGGKFKRLHRQGDTSSPIWWRRQVKFRRFRH